MKTEDKLFQERKAKLEKVHEETGILYPNNFRISHRIKDITERFKDTSSETLESSKKTFKLAGRIISLRNFGKSLFFHLQEGGDRIQAYLRKDKVDEDKFLFFKKRIDTGDIVGIEGSLFRTRTGELTLLVSNFQLLVKSLRPLPEKFHGLTDVEIRYRQRYLDLIMNKDVMRIFLLRTRLLKLIREFLEKKGFIEVETPMMHTIAGGATARPFKTYHNALDMELYLRIAPELFLKRLIVGGMERVFELNRNFRNEGISSYHNPEFTMLELYQAYATYEDLMELTEAFFSYLAENLLGRLKIEYQDKEIDLTPPWKRISFYDALREIGGISPDVLDNPEELRKLAEQHKIDPEEKPGKILAKLFDLLVEPKLIQPTFVILYPTDISPLARRNDKDPDLTDRFELFIAGLEVANGFSELNDPEDQYGRFMAQLKEKESGDEEAHPLDLDYIRALEYGLPPTAGEGIGIDRLVMLFANAYSIREVILFPLLRPEVKTR